MASDLRVTPIRNSTGLLNRQFRADCTFRHESGFWQNFAMTSPKSLYMKNAANKLCFPMVTHTAYFGTLFGSYGLLNSGYGADQILDRLVIQVIDQVFGPQEGQI
jgi:hypothetical protein